MGSISIKTVFSKAGFPVILFKPQEAAGGHLWKK